MPEKAGTRKGIVVSCCYPWSSYALKGPRNDALFYEHMLRSFGFTDVRTLSDFHLGLQSSHRGNILRLVQWLVEDARPGDNLAFVFSGHGLSTTSTLGDRRDELDNALLAADLEDPFPANMLFDTELQGLFSLLPAGVLLTCIIDAPGGDSVLRLPMFFDGKTGSFSKPLKARHCSLWAGEKYNRHRRKMQSDFTIRGAPTSAAKCGAVKCPPAPKELFPGVAAFLLCACRPDQVCLETPLGGGGPTYGLFTSSLAAALQQALLQSTGSKSAARTPGGNPQLGQEEEADLTCPWSYLQLARIAEDELQKRLGKVCDGTPGLEQHILLGCSQDPSTCTFLGPATEVHAVPRSVRPSNCEGLPAAALASLVAGSGGEPRWPNILVQLCRVHPDDLASAARDAGADPAMFADSAQLDPLARCLLRAEVLGEFWLPPLAHIFPEASLPGDPLPPTPCSNGACRAPRPGSGRSLVRPCRAQQRTFRTARKELWCRLRTPAVGTDDQCCTWGAALHRDQFPPSRGSGTLPEARQGDHECELCGYREERNEAGRVPSRPSDNRHQEGAAAARMAYANAAQKLRAGVGAKGAMTAVEFEYFAVRELGLDLAVAQKVYAVCASGCSGSARLVAVDALADVLEELSLCRPPEREDPGYLLEARLELEWRSTIGLGSSAAAGELHLFAADLRPRELPKDTLLARLNAREADLGYGRSTANCRAMVGPLRPSARTPRRLLDEDLLPPEADTSLLEQSQDGSVLFLKFGLCASRDVYPDTSEVSQRGMLATPRLNAPQASWVLPHVVLVSPALLHARLPTTGESCAYMPPPDDMAGCVVPVCTCARLCDTQRAAFALAPAETPRDRLPEKSSQPAVKPVPATPFSKYLPKTGSDSQLPFSLL